MIEHFCLLNSILYFPELLKFHMDLKIEKESNDAVWEEWQHD